MLSDKLLDSIDIFGAPAHSLNFEGRHRIHTWLGAVCSLVLFTGISLFAAIKVNHVFTRHNPKISRHAIHGQFQNEDYIEPCIPTQLNFNQSILQGSYLFYNVKINGWMSKEGYVCENIYGFSKNNYPEPCF